MATIRVIPLGLGLLRIHRQRVTAGMLATQITLAERAQLPGQLSLPPLTTTVTTRATQTTTVTR